MLSLSLKSVEFKIDVKAWKKYNMEIFFKKNYKTNEMVAKFFAKTMQGAKKTSLRTSHTKLIGRGGM